MLIDNIAGALGELIQIKTMLFMIIGVFAGLMAGAIPGFTIAMAVVLVLPFTFSMTPVEGLATMMAVYVGGLSGGLMSGILTGIPGTPSSVATTFDGYPMARSGRPGLALGLGVWASFFGGTIGAVILMLIAPQLAEVGLEFQPWDFFSLIIFALTVTASLAGDHIVKGLIAGLFGLLIATMGVDDVVGFPRFNFGSDELLQGFAFLPVLVGLFAFSRLLGDIRDPDKAHDQLGGDGTISVRIEHRKAAMLVLKSWVNLIRSSLIGVFVGVLPAAGSSISNIIAYDQAKKAKKDNSEFGKGAVDGIIAPEAANNATAGGALIVMMALGIPGDIITAIMLGALLIHDVVPSPSFIADEPVLAYSIFLAFFIANFMMLIMQSITLRGFVHITRVKMYMLTAVILFYCSIGVFALNNIEFDLWTLFIFGILGYIMRCYGFPIVPMILGVVLGAIAETNLARAVAISDDYSFFFTRPWSMFFLLLAVMSIIFPIYQAKRHSKNWTRYFIPVFSIILAGPLFIMDGTIRPVIAAGMVVYGCYGLYRAVKAVPFPEEEETTSTAQ